MPKLRFPEFSEEWVGKKFGNFCSVQMGQSPSSKSYTENSNDTILIQGNADLKQGKVVPRIFTTEITKTSAPGDIILTVRAPVGDIAMNKYFACIGRGVCSIKGDKFVYFLLDYLNEKNIWKALAQGSTFEAINSVEIKNLKVNIPNSEEQQKTASFLSKVDEKIEKLEKKQELWETYKIGIMQQIFSQKLRFKDENGENYPDWNHGKMKDVVVQEVRKVKKPEVGYWRLGLRSHAKGTFHEFVDDPEKIAMDYLYSVKENDLILNITFAWEHAIALASKDDENKLVSHRFPTYRFFEGVNPFFYKYYVTLPKFKHELGNISPGGAGRNRVMRKAEFLELNVPIPTIHEQIKIANLLSIIDRKVDELKKELEINNKFKKGLLQQMFC